jgi:hypothetical protein
MVGPRWLPPRATLAFSTPDSHQRAHRDGTMRRPSSITPAKPSHDGVRLTIPVCWSGDSWAEVSTTPKSSPTMGKAACSRSTGSCTPEDPISCG